MADNMTGRQLVTILATGLAIWISVIGGAIALAMIL